MPDILTAAQRTAFAGPTTKGQGIGFTVTGTLTDGVTTHTVDNNNVISWGKTRVDLYGWNPRRPGRFAYPTMSWLLKSPDGLYAPKASGSIWGADGVYTDWTAQLEIWETMSVAGTSTKIVDITFDVEDVYLEDSQAVITSIHKLARYWSVKWEREAHRHETDWNGNAHTVTL